MPNPYVTGLLIFAVVVIAAVLKWKFGPTPPRFFSYFLAAALVIGMFLLPRGQYVSETAGVTELAAVLRAQSDAITRFTDVLQFALLFIAMWILTENTRIEEYILRIRSEPGGDEG